MSKFLLHLSPNSKTEQVVDTVLESSNSISAGEIARWPCLATGSQADQARPLRQLARQSTRHSFDERSNGLSQWRSLMSGRCKGRSQAELLSLSGHSV